MALANCVKDLLCGLSGALRNALVAILESYIVQLDVLIAAKDAELVKLNVLAVPVLLVNPIAQDLLAQAKAGANLLPLDIIADCFQFGQLNLSIQTNLDALAQDISVLTTDIARLLSAGDEVRAVIADLQEVRNFYVEVIAQIVICAED